MKIRGIFFLACFTAVPLLAEVVVPKEAPPVQKRAAAELGKYIPFQINEQRILPGQMAKIIPPH